MSRVREPRAPSVCLLVVVGVEHEARALTRRLAAGGASARDTLTVLTVGPGAALLARLDSCRGGPVPAGVIVTGLCGGCAPGLSPGDLVVGEAVGSGAAGPWLESDSGLLARAERALERAGLRFRTGRLLTTPRVVATPAEKRECWERQGVLGVDLESAPVLAWAARAGLPAVAVRGVADGPDETLPAEVAAAVGSDGRLRVPVVLAWAARPSLVAAAWRIGWRSRVALQNLARFLDSLTRAPIEP